MTDLFRDKGCFGSLFTGLGGTDLGFERAGWQCAWQVEIDPWRQQVLSQHWPEVPRFGNVSTVPLGMLHWPALVYGAPPMLDDPYGLVHAAMRVIRSVEAEGAVLECSPKMEPDDLRACLPSGYAGIVLRWTFRIQRTAYVEFEAGQRNHHILACGDERPRWMVLLGRTPAMLECLITALKNTAQVDTSSLLDANWYRPRLGPLPLDWPSRQDAGTLFSSGDHELLFGFPLGWSCICGLTPCLCDEQQRVQALFDATPVFLMQAFASSLAQELRTYCPAWLKTHKLPARHEDLAPVGSAV